MEATSSPSGRLVVPGTASAPLPRVWKALAAVLRAVFPLLLAALSLELWMVLGRTSEVSSVEQLSMWSRVTATLAVWLVAVSILAGLGAYRAAPIAIPAGVPMFAAIGLFLLTRVPYLPQLLEATPPSWLIATMVVRLAGGPSWSVWPEAKWQSHGSAFGPAA